PGRARGFVLRRRGGGAARDLVTRPPVSEPVVMAVRRGLQPRRGRPAGATSPVPGAAASPRRGRRPGRRKESTARKARQASTARGKARGRARGGRARGTARGHGNEAPRSAPRQAPARREREGRVGESAYGHVPVMAGRVAQLLVPVLQPPAVMVDATLGRVGHARALLAQCPGLVLIGIDADEDAIEHAQALAREYPGQVTLAHSFYDQVASIVASAGYRRVQGILFDLGVSSPQLDDSGRGFSYAREAPLDMRMDQSAGQTAADIVNGYTA